MKSWSKPFLKVVQKLAEIINANEEESILFSTLFSFKNAQ